MARGIVDRAEELRIRCEIWMKKEAPMPGESHPRGSGHSPLGRRNMGQRREANHTPEVSGRPRSWEATLWGRHIRCHDLDQHLYLDGRFLDLTPIEFGLFWLLLRQALQVNTGVAHHPPYQQPSWGDERSSGMVPERYLQALGIVPILALVQAMSADLSWVIANWPAALESRSSSATATVRLDEEKESSIMSRSRASLNSHLDRLRSKLRCHGLDIGTVLLYGRSARGYLLCPLGDGVAPGSSAQ
jgi:hypothetical protein